MTTEPITRTASIKVHYLYGVAMAATPPFMTDPTRACADPDVDPEAFFAENTLSRQAAIRICRRCPLELECGTWAVDTGQLWGVWGGITQVDRRRTIVARRAAA